MSTLLPPHRVVETVSHVAPFGLGLWDVAAGRLASEGLTVSLYPLATTPAGPRALAPVAATVTRAGVFVAYDLPGLRTFEAGAGDDAFWAPAHQAGYPRRPFLVEVRDALGRFTPFALAIELPAPRWLVLPACVTDLWPASPLPSPLPSPARGPAYVPLLGTAARPAPAGMTAVRATLRDASTMRPAESAVLEVHDPGGVDGRERRLLGRGIADARGEVAALVAYPEVAPPVPSSPPESPLPSPLAPLAGARPLAEQEWTIAVTVRYRRDLTRHTLGAGRPPLPDLCDVLRQPPAAVTSGTPPVLLTVAPLCYGEELVLGAGRELSITPS